MKRKPKIKYRKVLDIDFTGLDDRLKLLAIKIESFIFCFSFLKNLSINLAKVNNVAYLKYNG